MLRLVTAAAVASLIFAGFSANAEQVVVRKEHVQYSNDTISDGGRTVACIITAAVVVYPDNRVLNFQILSFNNGRVGWKITGGTIDFKTQSATALRALDGSFTSSRFIQKGAFQKSLTPEGQLVGVLVEPDLLPAFVKAFTGPYWYQ